MNHSEYINELLRAIKSIAAGDYSVKAGCYESSKELEALGAGINMLSEEVKVMRENLREKNRNLKATEEHISELKEKYEEVIDNMASAVAVYKVVGDGKDFVFENFNHFAEKLDGVTKAYVYGKSIAEVFPSAREIGIIDALKRVYKSGKPEHLPVTFYQDDRISGWRNNYIYKLSTDEVAAVYTDETERLKALEELKASHEQFKLAVQGSSDGIWDWNLVTNELFLSPQWKAQLGYADRELENSFETFMELIYEEDRDMVMDYVQRYFKGALDEYNFEFRMKHKEGGIRWIMARGEALRNKNGEPVRMAGSHTDITLRKRHEEELESLNATKDKLFSIISHDLKNPFQSILGLTQLLLDEDNKLAEDQRESIQMIHDSGENAFDLLQNLLEWSRIQRGKMDISPVVFNLKKQVDQTISLFLAGAREKNIQLYSVVNDDLTAYADERMISTVLRNLLSNALKFTPAGREITVQADRMKDKRELKISVIDQGVGISPSRVDKLFDVGGVNSTPGTENEQGTGLGLVLCREFVEENNGRIMAESKEGEGSRFVFYLPEDPPE